MSQSHEHHAEEESDVPSSLSVMDKYKTAGKIAGAVIERLVTLCKPGASCFELCRIGDKMIAEKTAKVFSRDKMLKKGVAFPTCISPNHFVCHFSPLKSEDLVLSDNDVVKIDLGVQIDGYAACVATTCVVGASKDNRVKGRKADTIIAAHRAAELALKCMKVGKTVRLHSTKESQYNRNDIKNLMSYNTYKNVLEGHKKILLNPSEAARKDYPEQEFSEWDVFYLDVFITNCEESKAKTGDTRTTVFRRTGNNFDLRGTTSKDMFRRIIADYQEFGFSLNSFEDENKSKLGVKECVDHSLLISYPVLFVEEPDIVAHFKFTVVITPKGPIKIVSPPFKPEEFSSTKKIILPELIKLNDEPLTIKNKVKKQEVTASA
ncbi:Proliferation-associated protein 2G4 [Thelohanellus kitauei]|uniref:Proliferation-associated protein 2G4 n=1 Tax=Thelohanellus kitauei TaxID=669202 RepID=A0A0C2MJX4_THEKT|nr:Proliferation-associated protein 2G4 [Thelohanellus kitauei]